jgi:hypothetical protein
VTRHKTRLGEIGAWPSRLAALAVLALLAALLHAGLVAPYLAYVDGLEEGVAAQSAILARMRALAETPDSAPAAPVVGALLLPDGSEAQALAELQDRLKGFGGSSGLDLQGIQVLPRADTQAVTRLGVRLRGTGDVAALNRFLHAVESAEPALVVDNLRVQSRAPRGAMAGAAAPPLDLQFDVVGFRASGT